MTGTLEPAGLLDGESARLAVSAGWALPLLGGPAAFSTYRRLGDPAWALAPVAGAPTGIRAALARLGRPVADATGLPAGPLVMGILNVTPDSFSDGGRFAGADAAIATGLAMAEAGADLVDVGGESTRPGAEPVPVAEETERVLPVVSALVAARVRVSVDSRNAAVLAAGLDAGAVLANDVSALAHDPGTAATLAGRTGAVCLMHMRGDPRTMRDHARYHDVAAEVVAELEARIEIAVRAGIARGRLLVDPGIGFAKDDGHNLELLRRLPALANLGCRVLLGVSRKRFIGTTGAAPRPTDRLPGSLMALLPGLQLPGTVFRVHDVAETVQALRIWRAIQGAGTMAPG